MIIKVSEKDSVELEVYQGSYSLTSLRQGADGKDYRRWVKHGDGPVRVTLGDRASAIALCRAILEDLGSNVPNVGTHAPTSGTPCGNYGCGQYDD